MPMIQVPFGRTMVSRVAPLGSPAAYKTYGARMPLSSHWRPATCEEVGCKAYRNGWVTTVDTTTDLGLRQFEYCSHDKTRSYHMQRVSLTLVKFVYKPGNRCFRSRDHRVPLERPAVLTVRGGDWRAATSQPVVHTRAEFWVEDFSGHLDSLATARQRG